MTTKPDATLQKMEMLISMKHENIRLKGLPRAEDGQVSRIRIAVNPARQRLILCPCGDGDKDSIRMIELQKDPETWLIENAAAFTEKVYQDFSWDPELDYTLFGTTIIHNGERMLLFMREGDALVPIERVVQNEKPLSWIRRLLRKVLRKG